MGAGKCLSRKWHRKETLLPMIGSAEYTREGKDRLPSAP